MSNLKFVMPWKKFPQSLFKTSTTTMTSSFTPGDDVVVLRKLRQMKSIQQIIDVDMVSKKSYTQVMVEGEDMRRSVSSNIN